MLAGTWITLLSLSGVGAAASRRAASPGSLAFLDLDEFDPVAAVKGIPGAVRDNLRIFRAGTGAMWRNRKAASVVRKRVKQGGAAASYSELLLLRKSGDDAQKLLRPCAGTASRSASTRASTRTMRRLSLPAHLCQRLRLEHFRAAEQLRALHLARGIQAQGARKPLWLPLRWG